MTMFRTQVFYLPPTPLGLLPGRWAVEHHCTVCRARVAAQDLIPHAQRHTDAVTTQGRPQQRVP
jgi:hypothetical protein